jgi:hypothetical protein
VTVKGGWDDTFITLHGGAATGQFSLSLEQLTSVFQQTPWGQGATKNNLGREADCSASKDIPTTDSCQQSIKYTLVMDDDLTTSSPNINWTRILFLARHDVAVIQFCRYLHCRSSIDLLQKSIN